ncbi:MAG: hypothetical protein IH920_04735 [Chloroflexi bacterium]|nr:hypothetical protein [Chloroflexota bacterium]
MATDYPVTFDVVRPERFERTQVFLRILLLIIISIVTGAVGWIFGLVYLLLPVLAAILVSNRGRERFIEEEGARVSGWLRWLVAFYAYLIILTDRFPTERPGEIVRFEVRAGGSPTVGSALLRLIYSIPNAFVFVLLGIVSVVVWLIAALMGLAGVLSVGLVRSRDTKPGFLVLLCLPLAVGGLGVADRAASERITAAVPHLVDLGGRVDDDGADVATLDDNRRGVDGHRVPLSAGLEDRK